jgi:histidine ammonia-lyase
MDKFIITGNNLTVNDVVNVARHGQKIELHPDARNRINICRAMLEKKIAAHEIMYGVNTGIGEFSEIVLNDDQIKDFQKYLVYNHAAGIGDPAPLEIVRGAMLGRINVHAHGNSGNRLIWSCLFSNGTASGTGSLPMAGRVPTRPR